jgi:site-specific recombinase XerD
MRKPVWSRSTYNSYCNTLQILTEFYESSGLKDHLNEIDLKFYNSFIHYCYSKPRNYSINHVGKQIQNLKAVLNSALSEGIISNLKFKHKDFKKPYQKTSHIYLTLDELEVIRLFKYENEKLSKVRDILIVLCFTGLRFSDVYSLDHDSVRSIRDINNVVKILEVLTKKTGKVVSIPLHPYVENILDKYKYSLPRYSNQKINEYLKYVASEAGLTDIVSITTSIAGKPVMLTKPKYKFVCSHIGRRSFITNMYLNKIDSHAIRMISGHASESEFQKYIKVSLEQNSINLSKHPFFNEMK